VTIKVPHKTIEIYKALKKIDYRSAKRYLDKYDRRVHAEAPLPNMWDDGKETLPERGKGRRVL
jgi:phosphodiesterase/alkaline phosphatase D-like protein